MEGIVYFVGAMGFIVTGAYVTFSAGMMAYEGITKNRRDGFKFHARMVTDVDIRDLLDDPRDLMEKYPSLRKYKA